MAARSRLQRDIDSFRARLVRMEAQATDALSAAYADTLATLDTQIVALAQQIASAQAAGETVNPSWLFQQARYQELRRQVLVQMERYAAQTHAVITAAQHAVIPASLQQAGVVLAPVSGGSGELAQLITSWAQLPERSIANMVGALQQGTPLEQSLARFGVDAAMQAQRTLVRGLALGWGADKTAREVRSSLGITRTAAERLTRTETMRAARTAAMAAYEQSGVVTMVRWSASLSARTCGYCLSRHGTLYPLGTIMATHPNCFPAGTLCSGPEVVGSSVRWYVGDLVDIRFASGNHISVTPNHPILTPHGWVAAGLLNEGSSVIRSSLSEGELAAVYPNYQDGPAFIEEIAESFGGSMLVTPVGVPTSPEDFHGDGIGSNISVIRSNRFLRSGLNATISEPALKDEFGRRRVGLPSLAGLGRFHSLLDSSLSSAHSLMGLCGECLAFLWTGLSHSGVHAFGSVTGGNSGSYQALANTRAIDLVVNRQGLLGLTRQVSPYHLINGESVPTSADDTNLVSLDDFPFLDRAKQSALFQDERESRGGDMAGATRVLNALSGQVETDRVVDFSVRSFSGHVYNLETSENWYIANSIVTHNCRCVWTPYNPAWSEVWQSGEAWLAEQSSAVQRRVLGVEGARAFAAGELALADFEVTGTDPDWGPFGGFGGLAHAQRKAAV